MSKYTKLISFVTTIDLVSIHAAALVEAVLNGDINQMDTLFAEIQHDIYRVVGNDKQRRALLVNNVIDKTLTDEARLIDQPAKPKPEYARRLL